MRKLFLAILLGAGMIATVPTALRADDNHAAKRYYDKEHKDYHEWNDNEGKAYRHWVTEEKHQPYRDFHKAKRNDQADYWRWRHDHADYK